GPGCPADSLAEITQRGFRADENTPGSGLGLAIAQDIAGTYGAVLEFANKAPGLAVRITFKPGTLI
ncbi:MAG: two-component sensor histidine kinase, partial [Limnobacter sp.]